MRRPAIVAEGWVGRPVPCILCGRSEFAIVVTNDVFSSGFHTVVCRGCGFVHTNPRPSNSSYEEFYRGQYRRLYWPGVTSSAEELSLTEQRERDLLAMRVARYSRYVPPGCRVLDVGAGFALLLRRWAREKQLSEAVGQDLDVELVAYLKLVEPAVEFVSGTVSTLQGRQFDVIQAFHVLEHVLDPLQFLKDIESLLADDGVVLLEVPDIGAEWRGIGMFHPAHLSHFSETSIRRLMKLAGFRVVSLERWAEYPAVESLSLVLERGQEECLIDEEDPEKVLEAIVLKIGPRPVVARIKKRLLVRLGIVAPKAARYLQRIAVNKSRGRAAHTDRRSTGPCSI